MEKGCFHDWLPFDIFGGLQIVVHFLFWSYSGDVSYWPDVILKLLEGVLSETLEYFLWLLIVPESSDLIWSIVAVDEIEAEVVYSKN